MTDNAEPTNAAPDIEHMIDNPTVYGFDWGYGHLLDGGRQVTMGKGAPRIEHKSVVEMTKHFGEDYFLGMANGQSGRVRDQTIRDELANNIPLRSNDRGMKRWILEKALGLKARRRTVVTETKYQGLDKKSYDSEVEANAANIAFLVDKGMSVDEAKDMLGLQA